MNPGTWSTSAQRGGTWAEERRGRPHTFPSATMRADATHRSRPRHRAHPATRRKRSHRPWNIRMRPPWDPLGCIFCVDRSTIGAYMQGSQVQVNDVRVESTLHKSRRTWMHAHQETHKRKVGWASQHNKTCSPSTAIAQHSEANHDKACKEVGRP